jgi:thiosulfate dehydrogenase
VALGAATLVLGCSSPGLVEEGEALFGSRDLSPSAVNDYSCRTCHELSALETTETIKPGAPLAGVTLRPTFYGGQYNDLLDAINACRTEFMAAPIPLEADEQQARALYAFLESLEPGQPDAAPFSVVGTPEELPRGELGRGQELYARACQGCHGLVHSGLGRLNESMTLLPEEFVLEHIDYAPRIRRIVVVEKVRHGGFFGYGGRMPPFSLEALSNEQLADIIEALDLPEQ